MTCADCPIPPLWCPAARAELWSCTTLMRIFSTAAASTCSCKATHRARGRATPCNSTMCGATSAVSSSARSADPPTRRSSARSSFCSHAFSTSPGWSRTCRARAASESCLVLRAAREAGIRKKVTTHSLRHSPTLIGRSHELHYAFAGKSLQSRTWTRIHVWRWITR